MKKTKKLITLILASLMAASLFAGCSKNEETPEPSPTGENVVENEQTAYKDMINYLQTNYSDDYFTNGNTPPSDVLTYGESQITGITAMEDFMLAVENGDPADIVIAAVTGDKDLRRFDYEVPERGERSSFILLDDDEAAKDEEITYEAFTEEHEAEEGVTWLQVCSY